MLRETVSLFSCEMGLSFRKISEIYMYKSFISLGLAGRWCSRVGVCLFVYPFFFLGRFWTSVSKLNVPAFHMFREKD